MSICFIKKKSVLWRQMDEARAVHKTEVNLPQEKIDFINDAYQKELQYWKNIALASKNENERKPLTNLAPLRVFFGS